MSTAYESIQAEQGVLGALMIDNDRLDDVLDVLTTSDFSRQDHQVIWSAIVALSDQQKPYDIVTLADYLDGKGELDRAGEMNYLGTLASNTPSAANIKTYAKIVSEKAKARKLAKAAMQINELSADAMLPIDERIDSAGGILSELSETKKDNVPQKASELLPRYIDTMEIRVERGGSINHSTGFSALDDKTLGFQPGELIVIAARPSMGKTAFSLNIAIQSLWQKKKVMFFSMEMPSEQILDRAVSYVGSIPLGHIRGGTLRDEQWKGFSNATMRLKESDLYIDDTPGLSPQELRARARRQKRKTGVGIIIVDYLQLMTVPGKSDNRTQEISTISRSLKQLAKEIGCPVVALSQLNRSLESRPNKRPRLSDLRESGAIEQDADVIMFIYRDEVYDEDSPENGMAEIIIGKQRQGETGTVRLSFDGSYCRFQDPKF